MGMSTTENFTTRIAASFGDVHRAVWEAFAQPMKATIVDGANPLIADVPRAIRKNRWGARVTAGIREAGPGETDVDWTVEHTGTHHRDILDEVLGAVPFAVVVTSEPPPKPTFRQVMQEATANAEQARRNAASEASQARRTALAEAQFNGLKLSSKARTLSFEGRTFPIAGAQAVVELGAPNSRLTATRILAVGVFALAAKKDKTKVFITVALADGQSLVVEGNAKKQESAAREFAAAVNSAGARRTERESVPEADRSVPPPPSAVPAGWYPDTENASIQRYWDGSGWTEHTAPNVALAETDSAEATTGAPGVPEPLRGPGYDS
ncbi:MAG: DUF2510 domain-containing protein [Gordonia sp. (in: high G+C Gram-positive bacteria)]|uniref:DUF2510 domain-containing protein n=1 Tax=Gordonia sp. (in: high G+C Gram-positive bacteria) TaxID=84139 RepID=UPI003BB72294